MTTTRYDVTGLTCGHCAAAITEEVSALPGVTAADVDLAVGGASGLTVTSDAPLPRESLIGALAEAGPAYALADD